MSTYWPHAFSLNMSCHWWTMRCMCACQNAPRFKWLTTDLLVMSLIWWSDHVHWDCIRHWLQMVVLISLNSKQVLHWPSVIRSALKALIHAWSNDRGVSMVTWCIISFIIFFFTENGVSFYDKWIQHLQCWQISEKVVNLFFLVKIDVKAVQHRHRDEWFNSQLKVFNRIPCEIELNNLGQHRQIIR